MQTCIENKYIDELRGQLNWNYYKLRYSCASASIRTKKRNNSWDITLDISPSFLSFDSGTLLELKYFVLYTLKIIEFTGKRKLFYIIYRQAPMKTLSFNIMDKEIQDNDQVSVAKL